MQTSKRIDVHGLSVRGDEHERNHDHFAIASLNKSLRLHQSNLTIDDESRVHGDNQGHLFLVADGISGCPAPARASGAAVDSVVQYFLNEMPWYHLADGAPEDVTLALEDALRNAEETLMQTASGEQEGLGTTLTLAFVSWPHLYIAHVGDSRCYLSRDGKLQQLTTDHTLAEVRRDVGGRVTQRSEDVLWNALGGRESSLKPEVRYARLRPGDWITLVTDGVTKKLSKRRLRSLLGRNVSAEDVCNRLVDEAGDDDRTAVVVRFLPMRDVYAADEDIVAPPPLSAMKTLPKSEHGVRVPPDRRNMRAAQ